MRELQAWIPALLLRYFGKLFNLFLQPLLDPGWAEAGGGGGVSGEDMSMFRIGNYPEASGEGEGGGFIIKSIHILKEIYLSQV